MVSNLLQGICLNSREKYQDKKEPKFIITSLLKSPMSGNMNRSYIDTMDIKQHHQSLLSISESEYIRQGCCNNCRLDGRTRNQYRHYTIVTTSSSSTTTTTDSSSTNGYNSISSNGNRSSTLQLGYQPKPSLLYNNSSLKQCYGSSRLYDTITNGYYINMICSIKAELVQPTSSIISQNGDIELSLFTDPTTTSSSCTSILLREYESSLQQYYIPCLLNMIQQQQQQKSGNDNEHNNKNNNILCIIPGLVVWKLYIDVHVLSLLSNSDACTAISSVYYLDAVTHCINAAITSTTLPNITINPSSCSTTTNTTTIMNQNNLRNTSSNNNNPSILDRIVFDSNMENARPIIIQQEQVQQQPSLPIIISAHLIRSTDTMSSSNSGSINQYYYTIFDASIEEEKISNVAIHVVLVPTSYLSRNDMNNENDSSLSSSSLPLYNVASVWKTGNGSIPTTVLLECIETIKDIAVQITNQQKCYHLIQL